MSGKPQALYPLTTVKELLAARKYRMVARVVAKSMQTLDIADMDEAIRFLLSLRTNHFDHISPGKTGQCDADVYKRPIRGKMAYIKFYIDDDDPEVVVISLHEDEK